jgi:hypothetical protein
MDARRPKKRAAEPMAIQTRIVCDVREKVSGSGIALLLLRCGTKLKKSLPHVSVVLPVTSFRAVSLRNR